MIGGDVENLFWYLVNGRWTEKIYLLHFTETTDNNSYGRYQQEQSSHTVAIFSRKKICGREHACLVPDFVKYNWKWNWKK